MDILSNIKANGNELKNFLVDKVTGFTKSGFAKKDGRLLYDVDGAKLEFCAGAEYLTLKTESKQTASAVIAFDNDSVNGSLAAPLSGAVSLASVSPRLGMVAVIFHNDTSEPQYPSGFQKLTGDYVPSTVNVIYAHHVGGGVYLYTISQ